MLAWPVCWALHSFASPLPCLSLHRICPARMYEVIDGSPVYVSRETDAYLEQQVLGSFRECALARQ